MDTSYTKRPARPEEGAEDAQAPRPYKAGIVAELIELDRELMKMLVRRAKLTHKLRGGKEHAATPAAARAEKDVRSAWEKNAVSFSRDDKFARQLFTLLQEVRVEARVDAETRSAFNLAPARKPVVVDLAGPLSVPGVRMFAALAASLNSCLILDNASFNDPLMDFVKALNNAGAGFSWTVGARIGEGRVIHALTPSGLNLSTDKALYVGEDLFNIYLMAFLAASKTGKARFTGGSGLKMADLSPLRRFLPDIGARFAHSVPKSNGLPGNVEASGMLPDQVVVPADLPREGLMAFFCAAATWRKEVRIDCAALPTPLFAAAFAETLPVLRACSVKDSVNGAVVTLDARDVVVPEQAPCPLDAVLSGYLLSLPAFAGGDVRLGGVWDNSLPQAAAVWDMLTRSGLVVQADDSSVRTAVSETEQDWPDVFDLSSVDPLLVPLGCALAARRVWKTRGPVPAPVIGENADAGIVERFFEHAGVTVLDGVLHPAKDFGGAEKTPWTCPSAAWAFAYAFCAYDCQNIGLSNPAVTGALMPSFWAFYNTLPNPSEIKKVQEKPEKARRRIIME